MNIMEQLKVVTSNLEEFDEIKVDVNSYVCKEIIADVKNQKISISFLVKKFKDLILVQGKISGQIEIDCCRCLESFNFPLNLSFTRDYPADLDEVDVEEEVREVIILNVPDKPLCSADCSACALIAAKI